MSEETNTGIRGDAFTAREHLEAGDVSVQLDDAGAGHLAIRVLHRRKVPKRYASSANSNDIANDVENAGVPDETVEHG